MRLVIVGGGGFRVPLVYGALRTAGLEVAGIVLVDPDPVRLRVIGAVLDQLGAETGFAPPVRGTADLDAALPGADVVFAAMRVGGVAGRIADERVAMAAGLVGQETVGPGGVAFGLRTVPVAVRLAERVKLLAPDAWTVTFTNPAGLVTEAMTGVLGDRVIGICDSPAGLAVRIARALGLAPERLELGYLGLNHFGWAYRALVDGVDRLPELLADDRALASFEEGRLFGAAELRRLGAVPNEYLHYYSPGAAGPTTGATRGEYLAEQQRRFYAAADADPAHALALWRATLRDREVTYLDDARAASGGGERDPADVTGGGYERVAVPLVVALTGGAPARLILNVPNRGAVPGLDDDAVVEVPCLVDADGARPLPVDPDALAGATGLAGLDRLAAMSRLKEVERLVIAAAVSGSRAAARRAFAAHPLVGDPQTATLLDGYLGELPDLAAALPLP